MQSECRIYLNMLFYFLYDHFQNVYLKKQMGRIQQSQFCLNEVILQRNESNSQACDRKLKFVFQMIYIVTNEIVFKELCDNISDY